MISLGGKLPSGGNPYGALKTPGMPNSVFDDQAHPVSTALFHSLVRGPSKRTGKPPKIKGKLPLGLPFHGTGSNSGIGAHKFQKPHVGGISNPKFRI